MKIEALIFAALMMLLGGCGSGDKSEFKDEDGFVELSLFIAAEASKRNFQTMSAFSDSQLSDFQFSPSADYVEVRNLMIGSSATDTNPDEYTITLELDSDIKAQLTEEQRYNVEQATSTHGYDSGCLPGVCVDYLVALINDQTLIIDNRTDLLSFLGEVDTAAEIAFVLQIGTIARYFAPVSDGYQVLTEWYNCGNGDEGVHLLHIDRHANITLKEELVRQNRGIVC